MPALATESTKTRIPSVLAENGQTLTWLCRQIGFSRSYVWMMENGRRPMSDDYVAKAAQILGVPKDLLLTEVDMSANRMSGMKDEAAA